MCLADNKQRTKQLIQILGLLLKILEFNSPFVSFVSYLGNDMKIDFKIQEDILSNTPDSDISFS